MTRPNDFDIIPDGENGPDGGRMLAWLAGILVLFLFGCTVGIAFMRLSDRWQDQPSTDLVATVTTPTTEPLTNAATPVAVAVEPSATSGTPAAGQSPTATTTSTATPMPTPSCVVEVDPAFTGLNPGGQLGCAMGPAEVIWAAYEPFERGAMLWRSDTDAAYAFLANGHWQRIDARWDGQEPPSRGAPPPGLVVPTRGFGYVWATQDDLFQALGWALDTEKGFCARVQTFSDGWILASEPVPSCTPENLYNQATAGDWEPLLLIADEANTWSDTGSGVISAPGANGAASRPANQGVIEAPLPSLAITLDGNLSDWPGDWLPLAHVVQDADAFAGAPDLSGRFQLLHTDQGLLVAVRVQDDIYRPGPNGTDQWQGDGIEIQFDRDLAGDFAGAAADSDDYQLGIAFDAQLTSLRGYQWLPFSREHTLNVTGAVSPLGGLSAYSGYNAEFMIPWSWFEVADVDVAPGKRFGFNLTVNDNDGAAPAQQTVVSFSPARRVHDNPTQWATLVLRP